MSVAQYENMGWRRNYFCVEDAGHEGCNTPASKKRLRWRPLRFESTVFDYVDLVKTLQFESSN